MCLNMCTYMNECLYGYISVWMLVGARCTCASVCECRRVHARHDMTLSDETISNTFLANYSCHANRVTEGLSMTFAEIRTDYFLHAYFRFKLPLMCQDRHLENNGQLP